jgi:hypothetical protein
MAACCASIGYHGWHVVRHSDRLGAQAGDSLVVLEAESQELCQTGFDEEPELQWKDDREAALRPCAEIKHVFARTARDSPEVRFLALEVLVALWGRYWQVYCCWR